jgi:hypothetical protein
VRTAGLLEEDIQLRKTDGAGVPAGCRPGRMGYRFTYLMNGLTPESNCTKFLHPGEGLSLRFIVALLLLEGTSCTSHLILAGAMSLRPCFQLQSRNLPFGRKSRLRQEVEDRVSASGRLWP